MKTTFGPTNTSSSSVTPDQTETPFFTTTRSPSTAPPSTKEPVAKVAVAADDRAVEHVGERPDAGAGADLRALAQAVADGRAHPPGPGAAPLPELPERLSSVDTTRSCCSRGEVRVERGATGSVARRPRRPGSCRVAERGIGEGRLEVDRDRVVDPGADAGLFEGGEHVVARRHLHDVEVPHVLVAVEGRGT